MLPAEITNNSRLKTKKVTISTDGACRGNPEPGSYGTVLLYKLHRKELKQGFRKPPIIEWS